jgi:hypothetical protein
MTTVAMAEAGGGDPTKKGPAPNVLAMLEPFEHELHRQTMVVDHNPRM